MIGNTKKGSVWGGTKAAVWGLSILTLVFGFALVGCGGDDDDDPGTTPGGGGGKTTVYFTFWSETDFGNTGIEPTPRSLDFYLYQGLEADPIAFNDAQIAGIKALAFADLTFSPLTTTKGGNRTLTVEIDTARGGDYDDTGWKVDADKTRVSVAFKATRDAAPNDADSTHAGTCEETEVTIADKGNYTFAHRQYGSNAIVW